MLMQAKVWLSYTSQLLGLSLNQGYLEVTLDGRPLKTPSGNKLRLPPQKKMLATLIANEWDIQETILKPHTLPLVSFIYMQCLFLSDC
jgi:ATP synthase mitochondrial F1 complex assembly factor 2